MSVVATRRLALAAVAAVGSSIALVAVAPSALAAQPGEVGLKIHDIQGTAHLSPYVGTVALDVPGVVTAVAPRQFWMQDPDPDADPATSEGIVVYTNTAPSIAVGDAVTVSATVTEFRPGGASSSNLTTTELSQPTVNVVSPGHQLPAATVIGPRHRVSPIQIVEDDATGSVETSGVFDPATDGIDFYESLEGMRVKLYNAHAVGPTNGFGELPVVVAGAGVRTSRGGVVISAKDLNPERLILSGVLAPLPAANVGDTLPGPTLGVLDYSYGNFKLDVTSIPALLAGGLQRETTRPQRTWELAVATFNVENLDPADPQEKFNRLASEIVTNLAAPDLITVEEVQDNTGPVDDGVVAADVTLSKLIDAIAAAGGPVYDSREIDPANDADGGEPGGNIRVAFLFRTDRGLAFVDRPGGDAGMATTVIRGDKGKPQLTLSPGRIDPTSPAWTSSRKPLAGQFAFHGKPLFVIANHFNSKGGDQPVFGRFQPPTPSSEVQRHQQATEVRSFVDDILNIDANANVVVAGDLNDFDFSTTADILVGAGTMIDLPRTLPLRQRYTYDFEGNSQVLDHILISRGLASCSCTRPYDYDIVHVNSEFADQASDHDPQVVRLKTVAMK